MSTFGLTWNLKSPDRKKQFISNIPRTVSALDQKDCFYVCYTSYCECCRSPRLFLCVLCIKLCVPQINKTVSLCAMPHTGSASDQQD